MPKWIKPSVMIVIMLAALLMLASCGSGDKMEAARTNPLDLVTGDTGTIGIGGGGGGEGTGACAYSSYVCAQAIDSDTCSSRSVSGTFYPGQTCEEIGYTRCISSDGYTNCFSY